MDDMSRAWLAGLLEGEGWFGMHRKSSTQSRPAIELMMADEDVVSAAARIMGGTYRQVRRNRPDHHKTLFICRVVGGKAIATMREIQPLMGQRRAMTISNLIAERDA